MSLLGRIDIPRNRAVQEVGIDDCVIIRPGQAADFKIQDKSHAAAAVLNKIGSAALVIGTDILTNRELAWRVGNLSASGQRGNIYISTGAVPKNFAEAYAELLVDRAGLAAEVVPVQGGQSMIRVYQSTLAEPATKQSIFNEGMQADVVHSIKHDLKSVMSYRSDIQAALAALNDALPLQISLETHLDSKWRFDPGLPAGSDNAGLRLDGLKNFETARKVKDVLLGFAIPAQTPDDGPNSKRPPVVRIEGFLSIQKVNNSNLAQHTKRTMEAAATAQAQRGRGLNRFNPFARKNNG